MFQSLSLQPCWFALWQWRAEIWLVYDVFDTLATHSSLVHDISDTEGSWRIWHFCYTFQPCSWHHWRRRFMMYLTLLLHIPALFMTSLTRRVHDIFDTFATHSSLVHDITDTEGSWCIWHSCYTFQLCSWRHWQRVHDVFDTFATHSSLIHDVTDAEGSWCIWHSCYTFQPYSWRHWHRGFMTYLTLLLHISALFVISDTVLRDSKWQHSWSSLWDFQKKIFNKQGQKSGEKLLLSAVYSIPVDRASDASLLQFSYKRKLLSNICLDCGKDSIMTRLLWSMHASVHAHTHTHTHTLSDTRTPPVKHTHTHKLTHAKYTHVHVQTHAQKQTHTHTHAHTHLCLGDKLWSGIVVGRNEQVGEHHQLIISKHLLVIMPVVVVGAPEVWQGLFHRHLQGHQAVSKMVFTQSKVHYKGCSDTAPASRNATTDKTCTIGTSPVCVNNWKNTMRVLLL